LKFLLTPTSSAGWIHWQSDQPYKGEWPC